MDATYMSYRPSSPTHVHTRVDVSLLSVSDRACLRLLEYARVCTASQLATLVYPSLRTALRRTRWLYLDNLVTRESLPPDRGGIPLSYRLSSSGRRRIHLNAYRSPGLITTRHSLDGVEFVASLVRHNPGLVQLWWPEWLIPGYDWGVNPDHLVVIDTGEASALILVEVDESTERPPVIRDRLRAYAKLFEDHRVGWHLLWVANSRERLARLRQVAGPTKDAMLSGRSWGVAIDDVSDRGADAEVLAIGASLEPRPLRGIATDPKARRSEYEVGSDSWIRLLANGGQQDINGLWSGIEREQAEPEPVASALDVAFEEPAERAVADAQAIVVDQREAELPEIPLLPIPTIPAMDLNQMSSLDLAVLITARHRTTRQALRAASLLADRREWYHLEECADMLCHSHEPNERRLGLHLVGRHLAQSRSMPTSLVLLVRSLSQHSDPALAVPARRALEKLASYERD
jgi:hypothetical protein